MGGMGAALDLESEDQVPALLAADLPDQFPNLGNGRTTFLGCIDDSVHEVRCYLCK